MPALKHPKVAYLVNIILEQYRIQGYIHMHPGQRLSDFVNGVKDFIPVTDAKVYKTNEDKELASSDLLEVNVHHVLLVHPLEGQQIPEDTVEFDEVTEDSLKSIYVDPFKAVSS